MGPQPTTRPDGAPGEPPASGATGPDIRLLGGVTATDPSGRPIDVGPAKCQALLAALALSPGSAVTVDRLVTLVWGDDPPRTAEKTLQSYAARLRRSLGPERVQRVGAAYRLDIDPGSVDAVRFERRLGAGDLAAALAEWGGPPLAGLDPAGLAGTVAGLTEHWLTAVEADLEHQVTHDPGGAVGRLTELTAAHPFREGLWALLMEALYAVDRQAEALGAYRRARNHLVEELGVEPGPRLRRLEEQILGHDDQLRSPSRSAPPPTPPHGTVTFAFAEVEGAARLWSDHRRAAGEAVDRHEELARAVATEHDGHVFTTGGESVGVAFHRAGDGAGWAVALRDRAGAERWPGGIPVRVRIGLHTGDAAERTGNAVGPAVTIASRVASTAHGGQILASGTTAALLDGTDLRPLGLVRVDELATEQAVHQVGPGDHPPLRSETGRRGNLPRSPGRLFGRDELLVTTVASLRRSPVVTLVGPGGIGKTRLALEAARLAAADQSGGVWLVELADVTGSDDVARAVAEVLDVKELPGRSLLDTVVTALRTRRALLVLDNCEHVIDGAADVVEAVTAHDDEVRVLATSREGLGLIDEQLVAVGPLDVESAAVELFGQRAGAVDHTFDLDAHRPKVIEICRRLDGVPLAIELAAARVRTLSPADLVDRLQDSFRLLAGGRRKSVERHRTLRATIQWSHDLLSPAEQRLFRRLSIFAGSFDLTAAEAVSSDGDLPVEDVNDLLDDLVERSMVVAEAGGWGRRFRLLEIVRQYGADQLVERDDADLVAARHARTVADEIDRLAGLLAGKREAEGAGRLAELWPNLRAAVDWALGAGDLGLVKDLVGPVAAQTFTRRGLGEIAGWADRMLSLTDPDDDETIAAGLLWTAFHHTQTHDREAFAARVHRYGLPDHVLARAGALAVKDDQLAAIEEGPEIIAWFEQRGEHHLARLFEVFVASALVGQGELAEAEARLTAIAARCRAEGPLTFLNWSLYMLAASADFQGHHDRAEALYDEALAVKVPPMTMSPNEVLEARAAHRAGQTDRALLVLRTYAEDLLEVGNMAGAGLLALEFVNLMVALGRLTTAAPVMGYLECNGMLDVEGPGFRTLVTASDEAIAADPEAAAVRRRVVDRGVDDEWGLTTIRDLLDDVLTERSA